MSSIDYTTQHLARATTAMLSFNTTGNSNNSNENSNMNENHHNLTTLLSQVEKLLDHHVWLISSQTDLCRTLLHILHTIHKNGLLFNNNDKEDHAGHDHLIPFHNHPHLLQHVYTEIRQALASFPSQLTLEDGKKIKEIEAEFYQHLETLSRLVNHSVDPLNEEHPPAYQEVTHTFHGNKQGDFVPSAAMIKEEKPPQYQPNEPSTTCSEELDAVFQAIDRLSHVTPQFNNQRVERQLRIEPRHPATPKMLCDSIAQIQRVSRFKLLKRSNSAPSTTSKKSTVTTQRRVSATSTTRTTTRSDQVIETNHNNRHSLYEMTDLLVKSLHRPCFNKQRYQLTADKERDLFMNGLFNKVDRLEGRRLSNQDAEQPTSRLDELDQILNHICRSKQVQFENQRATFTVHST
ncbi:hypothetical protein BDA99DRAFT_17876 [Phascolomyces articulosus]|uniref:Uncharacterized protein n=1 Tax=Phascolomyces articulosus TaxID=60185 RepID=A0AAD5PKX1_9FUNG|nr:hypothetical protein BDA99DRAFT_17876 [Phascolomyces articulosus]